MFAYVNEMTGSQAQSSFRMGLVTLGHKLRRGHQSHLRMKPKFRGLLGW